MGYSRVGYELATLSIRVHNSLTVLDTFENIFVFQNVISAPPPSVIMTHCVRKSICDSLLTLERKFWVEFKDGVSAELHLKPCFDSDWYFCNITGSKRF